MNTKQEEIVGRLIRKYNNKAMKLRAILRAEELSPEDSIRLQLDARDHERTVKELYKLFFSTED